MPGKGIKAVKFRPKKHTKFVLDIIRRQLTAHDIDFAKAITCGMKLDQP